MNILKLENISLKRNEKTLLNNISFELSSGEKMAILGKNGSGKSLLLQLIAGYISPSSGEIYRFGEKHGSSDLREIRKKMGFLGTSIKKYMNENEIVIEAVISGKYATIGKYDNYSKLDYEKAVYFLELVNCFHLKDRFFGNLSDGEKERILIARALINDPSLLLLDEPCSNLDIASRESFLEALENIFKFHKTISAIFVTHHTEEITSSFNKILILKNGRIFKAGNKNLLNEKDISEAFDIKVKIFEQLDRKWSIANLT
ncbi:MAG: ATP-binding cassette domain-containing protein [Brevinematales bacterium]|nr:ATP-binding cassette domain-containing protein [Brevinematales bacterium]